MGGERKRRIIVYIATSADGFIARRDGSFDWLERPRPLLAPVQRWRRSTPVCSEIQVSTELRGRSRDGSGQGQRDGQRVIGQRDSSSPGSRQNES